MHDLKLNAELGPRGTRRIAMITIQAFSIANFRGPLVQELVRQKVKVFALAPDFDDATRAAVIALGAIPVYSRLRLASKVSQFNLSFE